MSLYTPVFPPSLELRSTERKGAHPPNQLSSTEVLRDIHLFLATKPEVLVPSSRPSSPSFDANVKKLKQSVLEAIDTARGDTGDRRWTQVSEKLKLGCVRGRYRLTGINRRWHPPEHVGWILPDDEETWFELEKEREEEVRRLKGKMKRQFRHPDDTCIPPGTPFRGSDNAGVHPPVETIRVPGPVSPKTMRNVTEKVAKWQATITTFNDLAPDGAKAVPLLQSSASKLGVKGKILAKDKSQSSSLGFPVVKRNPATVTDKKGQRRSVRDPLAPSSSKTPSVQERHAAPYDGEPEKTTFKTPLRSALSPDRERPKITEFPETPYIPPSFPSQLQTSTPQPRHVPIRRKPSPIHPIDPSSSIPHPSTPRDADQHHPGEDPYIVDVSSSLPMHSDGRQTNKRPLSPSCLRDIGPSSTPKKRRERSPAEEIRGSRLRPPTPLADVEKSKCTALPTSTTDADSRLPTLNELLAATPQLKNRPTGLLRLENILVAERKPSLPPRAAVNENPNPSPAKSYFSTPASGSSGSSVSARNLLIHSPVSPMLSFAQNPKGFLPQYTSTQARGGSEPGQKGIGGDVFGNGYSSQFDVERRVDRVSELLEKDVDFDGWLRDVPAVEEGDSP